MKRNCGSGAAAPDDRNCGATVGEAYPAGPRFRTGNGATAAPFSALLDEAALTEWGEQIGAGVQPPLVLALRGELGAGKSTLARAILRGTGVRGPLPSPTFNLVFRYGTPRRFPAYHLDLYRLENEEEVWELGWSELGSAGDLVLIEWPERAEALLPAPRWDLRLEEDATGTQRLLAATPVLDPPLLPAPRGATTR